jgi:hypothetical protein
MMASHAHSACAVHADFDPLSPTFLADPFAALASLPRETRVSQAEIPRRWSKRLVK